MIILKIGYFCQNIFSDYYSDTLSTMKWQTELKQVKLQEHPLDYNKRDEAVVDIRLSTSGFLHRQEVYFRSRMKKRRQQRDPWDMKNMVSQGRRQSPQCSRLSRWKHTRSIRFPFLFLSSVHQRIHSMFARVK